MNSLLAMPYRFMKTFVNIKQMCELILFDIW